MADSQALVVREESAIAPYHDPREDDPAVRLQQAKEHEAKLQHIMDTVPIKLTNVMGSTAGAGSGEFHMYRKSRAIERARLDQLEVEWAEKEKQLQFVQKRDSKQAVLDAKTDKNRAKRQRRKDKQQAVKKHKAETTADDTEAPNAAAAAQVLRTLGPAAPPPDEDID